MSAATPDHRPAGPPLAMLAFVGGLLLVGLGFLGLVAYRAWQPEPLRPLPDLAAAAGADLEQRGFRPLSGTLQELLDDPAYKAVATQPHPLLARPAPDFGLRDTDDKPWKLSDHLAQGPVVLVFYFGYHCDHCVSQLFALNQDVEKFRELGATLVAISGDPPALTRERFKKYGKFAFAVLSDPDHAVAEAYGAYRKKQGEKNGDLLHGTFVIERSGKIAWVNAGDEPFTEDRTLLLEVARGEGRTRTPDGRPLPH